MQAQEKKIILKSMPIKKGRIFQNCKNIINSYEH